MLCYYLKHGPLQPDSLPQNSIAMYLQVGQATCSGEHSQKTFWCIKYGHFKNKLRSVLGGSGGIAPPFSRQPIKLGTS